MDPLWLLALIITLFGLGGTFFFYYVALSDYQWFSPEDKTILITGCDSGIGYQIARHFATKGSNIIASVLSLDSEGCKKLQQEFNGKIKCVELNLRSQDSIEKFASSVETILGEKPLFALVNNAGICVFGDFDFSTDSQILSQVEINFLGPVRLIKRLLPKIIQSKGRIINVTSINVAQTFPRIALYSGLKSALETFSESLRMELSRFEVKISTVRLGDFAGLTDIMKKHAGTMKEQEENMDADRKELYGDYFNQVHTAALNNYGYFSPPSFQESNLFTEFDKVVYAVDPPLSVAPSKFSYKALIFFLSLFTKNVRESIIIKMSNTLLK